MKTTDLNQKMITEINTSLTKHAEHITIVSIVEYGVNKNGE